MNLTGFQTEKTHYQMHYGKLFNFNVLLFSGTIHLRIASNDIITCEISCVFLKKNKARQV